MTPFPLIPPLPAWRPCEQGQRDRYIPRRPGMASLISFKVIQSMPMASDAAALWPPSPYVLRTAPARRRSAFAGMAAIDADHGTVIVAAVRALNGKAALEKAMTLKSATLRPKIEHRVAERHRIAHVPARFLDVFNAPRDASSLQPIVQGRSTGVGGSLWRQARDAWPCSPDIRAKPK